MPCGDILWYHFASTLTFLGLVAVLRSRLLHLLLVVFVVMAVRTYLERSGRLDLSGDQGCLGCIKGTPQYDRPLKTPAPGGADESTDDPRGGQRPVFPYPEDDDNLR